MRVHIKNYIGIAKAELDIEPGITLLAGDNAQGKTSVLRGIGALVTGEVTPKGLGTAGDLIMDGRRQAELLLVAKDGETASITYPDPKYVAQGDPPHATAFSAGLRAYADLEEKDRSRFLVALLQATPTAEKVRKAFQGELAEEAIETVVEMLKELGWDETCNRLRERRVKLKGRFEDMTGERWGDQKSKDWLPQGWNEATDRAPPAQLQARVAASQEALDQINRAQIMGEAEYQALADLAGKREPTEMALDVAKKQLPAIEAAWAKLRQELDALPAQVEEGLPCPHCGAHVVIRPVLHAGQITKQFYLVPLEPLTEGEPERRRRDIAAKREEVAEAHRKLEQQQGLIGACEEKLREIAKAALKLKGAKKGNGKDQQNTEALAELQRAQASAARAKLVADAAEVAERVRYHSFVIDALGPDGLRRQELETKLAAFETEQLEPLTADLLTFRSTTIDRETLMPRYGNRPYVLCSKSEQWRCNVTLQIAIALMEGAPVICMDGADILSRKGQDDLFMGLLQELPIPVVVGATYDRPRDVPNLDKAGIGHVYWISDGMLADLTKEAAA